MKKFILILVAALLLLGSASAASAECAWVLWGSIIPGPRLTDLKDWDWHAWDAFEEKARRNSAAKALAGPALSFKCLPDTVKP